MNENRLLVMDDDPDVGAFFGQVGEDLGFDVRVVADPEKFAPIVLEFSPTVILLDLQMPGRDGIELLRELASLDRHPKVLIASGLDSRVLTTASGARHVHGRGRRRRVLQADRARRARSAARAAEVPDQGHHRQSSAPGHRAGPARRALPAEGHAEKPRPLDRRRRRSARALGAPRVRPAVPEGFHRPRGRERAHRRGYGLRVPRGDGAGARVVLRRASTWSSA